MARKSQKAFYIIGANSAGISLFHDIKSKFPYSIVIFLDDDPSKAGTSIESAPIMAPIEEALIALKPSPNTEVIIAMSSTTSSSLSSMA